MRTYSGFLIFQDLLDNLSASSSLLKQASTTIINPTVTVVEADCGTLLGTVADTTFELEGRTNLATGLPLTRANIVSILGQNKYTTNIRDLHSCISHNGICQKCYTSTYLDQPSPAVGSSITIPSYLTFKAEVIQGPGNIHALSLKATDYYQIQVIHNGALYSPTNYTISDSTGVNTLTINSNITVAYGDAFVVRYLTKTSQSLLGYISKTYTGGLLGISPLPTLSTPIRESLYQYLIPDGLTDMMAAELTPYQKYIPVEYLKYIDSIHDKLEKALFILYLYAIFTNIH